MKKHSLLIGLCVIGIGLGVGLQWPAKAASRLLPFQGRLTDAQGVVVADGARVVQFKLYNAPVAGQAVWNGEVQKLTVNSGLVSTLLGSKATLGGVDFNQDLYLELTLDANGDGQITLADPPLLPRQAILPAVFAIESGNARKLAGEDWTPLFGTNSPTGPLLPEKIADRSLTTAKLAPASVTGAQLALATVTSNHIAVGGIADSNLSPDLRLAALTPPGAIIAFGGETIPEGWLRCDGKPVSRTTYSRLYAAIKTAWGAGNGVDTFALPDLRGLFLRGVSVDPYRGIDPDRDVRVAMSPGGNTGRQVGSLQQDAFQGHSHIFYFKSIGAPGGGSPDNQTVYRFDAGGAPNVNFVTQQMIKGPATLDDYDQVHISKETRPFNAYVHYIIKY